MKYLYTTCGTQFQVSNEDEIFLAGFSWKFNGYYIQGSSGKYHCQYLHRIIAERMGLDYPDEIDHEDGNPLNNQRDNLRPATRLQNAVNSKIPVNNTSSCKGVDYCKALQKWRVRINGNHLGYFYDFEEACKIRKEAEIKYFKEFRREKND